MKIDYRHEHAQAVRPQYAKSFQKIIGQISTLHETADGGCLYEAEASKVRACLEDAMRAMRGALWHLGRPSAWEADEHD